MCRILRFPGGAKDPRRARLLPAVGLTMVLVGAGCEREARRYNEPPASANRETAVRLTALQPGSPEPPADVVSPYQHNAWGIGEGKRLYSAYNCAPCHAVNGGGAIGPALIDDKWIYGGQSDQIYASISQGRPNGMPSFGGHVTTQQIWQLVAYVQALSGQVETSTATGRNDDQMAALPESRQSRQVPVQTGHR
jgi:cytochrome c oxidase cbb3-type subunit III